MYVRVRVPATSANLGPGFDVAGLAVTLYNTFVFELLEEDISYFTKQVTPLFETIGNNLEEINRLKNFRDALLPKLLSGEISVNQATK